MRKLHEAHFPGYMQELQGLATGAAVPFDTVREAQAPFHMLTCVIVWMLNYGRCVVHGLHQLQLLPRPAMRDIN